MVLCEIGTLVMAYAPYLIEFHHAKNDYAMEEIMK